MLILQSECYDDQFKDDELGGGMSSMGEFHTEFWWKNLKEDLEDLGAGRIILKCIFKKQKGRM